MIAPLFGSITRPLLSQLVSGLRDELFGAFTPRSLFNDGSIGVLYDNNDLTTMFVDAAGTTPATANGLVGLQLDKSANLALGAELSAYASGFSSTAGISGVGSTVAISGSALLVTATSADGSDRAEIPVSGVTVGKFYKVVISCRSGSVGSNQNIASWTWASISPTVRPSTTDTTFEWIVQATATSGVIRAYSANGVDVIGSELYVNSISIKELPGNHRYQTTTGSKPILRGTPTGAELFTAYGTPGAGWSVAGATGTATTASSALPTTTAATVGKFYRVTYTVTRSAGSVQLSFGGRTGVSSSAAGQYVEYFDNALNTNALTATGTGFTGTVRIDEVKDVSAGSVTAPYGLQYDGVDDFLQTASVNFSATDKMFVCAGVRTLASASTAIFVEFGPSVGGNAGTFYISVPETSNNIGHRVRGSLAGGTGSVSGYTAPYTRVLSLIGDIAGDVNTLRANGAEIGTSAVDQGTGNFSNFPLYFGRRAGTSLPFNGLDFGFVIVGKTLTAAQISSTERWMAQRTGISI